MSDNDDHMTSANSAIDPTLQALYNQVHSLTLQLQQQQLFMEQNLVSNPYSHPSPTAFNKEPKVATPEKFNGNQKEIKNFIASVETIIKLQPSRFWSEEIKILFVGTLLTGDALTWFRTLLPPPSTLATLWDQLTATFGDPSAQWTARNKLKSLKQGKLSCVVYTTKFKQLALESGYDKIAQLQMYHDGLNDSIKDSLAQAISVPEELEAYMEICIKIDNRQFSRRMEKLQNRPLFATPATTTTTTTTTSSATPMQLDSVQFQVKGPLTSEEKTRRIAQGLCLYCGLPGHIARACPKKNQPKSPNSRVQTH